MNKTRYVLVSAAKDEDEYIEKTIKSVIEQTIRPVRWVIVSDGSTDKTEEIVERYEQEYDFIKLIKVHDRIKRDFSSKVYALSRGFEELNGIDYGYIGILDADVSFGRRYYEIIMSKFNDMPELGLGGGRRYDLCGQSFVKVPVADGSVGGPFQFFRQECFKQIGGFVPLEYGGEDSVAEISARMKGWAVKSFDEEALKVLHYRATGTATGNMLHARFRDGVRNYLVGYCPLFMFCKCLYRAGVSRPVIIGSVFVLAGYLFALFRMDRPALDVDYHVYFKQEQSRRLKEFLLSMTCLKRGLLM